VRHIHPHKQSQATQDSRQHDSLHFRFSFCKLLWNPGTHQYSLEVANPLNRRSDDQRQHLSYFLRLKYPMRSSTALAIRGNATVASSNTSAKRPPSSGGTNFPQETASVYVLPLKPPQWTGSGQMRTP